MGWVQADELKIGEIYEVEFLNGSKIIAKYTGRKGESHYFLTSAGQDFSIANNCIQYHRFYLF